MTNVQRICARVAALSARNFAIKKDLAFCRAGAALAVAGWERSMSDTKGRSTSLIDLPFVSLIDPFLWWVLLGGRDGRAARNVFGGTAAAWPGSMCGAGLLQARASLGRVETAAESGR